MKATGFAGLEKTQTTRQSTTKEKKTKTKNQVIKDPGQKYSK